MFEHVMNAIDKLTEIFKSFPGIGPRQAKRFSYYLLTRKNDDLKILVNLIVSLKKEIGVCGSCFRFFVVRNRSDSNLCDICEDKTRNQSTLMIVSQDVDLENIEKSGSYRGLYFVIGGLLPILEKNPANKIRIAELTRLIDKRLKGELLKEIILALDLNPEGEHTGDYLTELLNTRIKKGGLKISKLGRGLSTGTELEYSDAETLKNAIKNRF